MADSSRLARLRRSVWAAAAAIVVYQLFIPPIVGLSNQNDFQRVIGRFGYSQEDKATPLWSAYVQAKYIPDGKWREPSVEQAGPEYLFVWSAILLNKLVSKDGKLDIMMMGLVHGAAFLAVFAWLLRATEGLAGGVFLWIAALLALTDVGYVAYWNSFYTEPSSHIFFLALLCESIGICRRGSASPGQLARWSVWAAAWVDAKSSNFPVAVVLAPLALRMGWEKRRALAVAGAVAIAVAGAVNMWTRPKPMQAATAYDAIFMAILPESHTPAADLKALGLDPAAVRFSGSGAWTPNTAIGDMVASGAIGKRVTSATVGLFYLSHPARIWRRTKAMLPVAFSLRPEWCGNFEQSAGFPPGARSRAFSLWSGFHERVLARGGKAIVLVLPIALIACIAAWFRTRRNRLRIEFCAALCTCCLIAFLVPVLGDAWDNVKHLVLFNLLLDTTLITGVGLLWAGIRKAKQTQDIVP